MLVGSDENFGPVSVLVLGTAEWDAPIATNQQHVVRELVRSSRLQVRYMESMALRRPRATKADLRRIISRLKRALVPSEKGSARTPSRPVPTGVRVTSTMVIPIHVGFTRYINRRLLYKQVDEWLSCNGPRILLTYTPVTYGLEEYADTAVYHCVDLLGKVDGIPAGLIDANEKRLAEAGVTAIATSSVVADHLESRGFVDPVVWENVADVDVYEARARDVEERTGAIFAGNLTSSKLDASLLERIVDRGVPLALAGPLSAGTEAGGPIDRLMSKDGVEYLGLLSPDELAVAFSSRAVGLIPYALNEYTRGVSPLKVYEYLASGLSVVSTQLPGVHPADGDVFVVDSDAFVERVQQLSTMVITQEGLDRRLLRASASSWTGRGEQFRQLFRTMLSQT